MPRLVDSLTDNPEHRNPLRDLFGQPLDPPDKEGDGSRKRAFFAGVAVKFRMGRNRVRQVAVDVVKKYTGINIAKVMLAANGLQKR